MTFDQTVNAFAAVTGFSRRRCERIASRFLRSLLDVRPKQLPPTRRKPARRA